MLTKPAAALTVASDLQVRRPPHLGPPDGFLNMSGLADDRARAAYARARWLVWDRYPVGQVPPRDALSPAQLAALDEHESAEAAALALRWGDGSRLT